MSSQQTENMKFRKTANKQPTPPPKHCKKPTKQNAQQIPVKKILPLGIFCTIIKPKRVIYSSIFMSQRQVILLACIAEHCHGTQEKPEAKPTQNKHKPKTNTLSPQILLVCKNKLQTRIVFCLTIKRVSTIFFPVKSVFSGIPNLLLFASGR